MRNLSMDTITLRRVVKHVPIKVMKEMAYAPTSVAMYMEWHDVKGINTPFMVSFVGKNIPSIKELFNVGN